MCVYGAGVEVYLIYPVFSIKDIDTLTGLVMVVAAAGTVIKKSNFSFFPKAPVPKLGESHGLESRQSFNRTFI